MGLAAFSAERPTNQGVYGLLARTVVKGVDLLGLLGTVTVVVLICLAIGEMRRAGARYFDGTWLPAALVFQVGTWIWLPVEPSYLLPALPMILVWLAPQITGATMRCALIVLVVVVAASGWISLRFFDYQYLNVYGDGSCEPTESTGASIAPAIDAGVLLDYPGTATRLRACNETQRSSQLVRTPSPRSAPD